MPDVFRVDASLHEPRLHAGVFIVALGLLDPVDVRRIEKRQLRRELLVLFANLAAGDQSQLVRLLRLMGNGNLPGATACALLRSGVP